MQPQEDVLLRSQTVSYKNYLLQVALPMVTTDEICLFIILFLVIERLICATGIANFIIIKNNRI
jgi:hypothetical protein